MQTEKPNTQFGKGNKYHTIASRRKSSLPSPAEVCISMKNRNPLRVRLYAFSFSIISFYFFVSFCRPKSDLWCNLSRSYALFLSLFIRWTPIPTSITHERHNNISNKKSNRHRKWFLWTYHKTFVPFVFCCAAIQHEHRTYSKYGVGETKRSTEGSNKNNGEGFYAVKSLWICVMRVCLQTAASSYRFVYGLFFRFGFVLRCRRRNSRKRVFCSVLFWCSRSGCAFCVAPI